MIDFNEIAVLDRNALYLGVPTAKLMENAGIAVADVVKDLTDRCEKNIIIFCGLGNNGGDGMVAARHLAYNPEYFVRLILIGKHSDIRSKLASEQFHRIPNRVEVIELEKGNTDFLKDINLSYFPIIVDAMLGVGISGSLKEPYKSIVKKINSVIEQVEKSKRGKSINTSKKVKKVEKIEEELQKPKVISVDVPTGLGTDISVKPEITITFHDLKTGMTGKNSGEILIRDIGIPPEAEQFIGPGELNYIPKLRFDSHKGDRGRLLVVGGGPYTGAPALVGMSALRMGVDLVHIATPEWISSIIASYSPNFIVHSLGSGNKFLNDSDVDNVIELVDQVSADAVVIGPGLGRSQETFKAVCRIITKLPHELPIVLDADAFSALTILNPKELTDILKNHRGILTPHKGELKIMLKGMSENSFQELATVLNKEFDPEKIKELLKQFAKTMGADWTILLKGPVDIITDRDISKLNNTGNPGMTVGGTGDVLAGLAGALLAMGLNTFNAAGIAAFVNGGSGDLAWKKYGSGLMATDIIDYIPEFIKINNLE
jgi:NAD(P)H-hydrate epimerase